MTSCASAFHKRCGRRKQWNPNFSEYGRVRLKPEDLYLDERDRAEGLWRSLSVLSGILRSYSVIISFTSVGRHFPKNIALQSENPNR